MSEIQLWDREKALDISNSVIDTIRAYCHDIISVGGIRRQKDKVHDIDIVAWIDDHFTVSTILGNNYKKLKSEKTKYSMFIDDMKVEIYVALTERQYEVLKLVRTGSNMFNQTLCKSALDKDMALRYSYKEGLCGLYGAASNWDKEEGRFKYFVNPMRKIAYKEDEIIMTILNNKDFLDPKNRNLGYEEDYENEI